MSTATILTAHREYANRPADERFPSMESMIDDATQDKSLCRERTYNLRDLEIVPVPDAPDGGTLMMASPRGQAYMSHWAFGQLARTLGAPAGYLRTLPAPIAADALNYGLHDATATGTSVNLLARDQNGKPPMIRACTSEVYGRCWDSDLYRATADVITRRDPAWGLPQTWNGTPAGAYRGDRDSFLIITNGGSIVDDPSLTGRQAGDGAMFKGLLIRNSEVGASSVTIESILFRYICGNHILWGAAVDRRFRRRHVGKSITRDVVREIARIARDWTQAGVERENAIIRALIQHEIAHSREAVIDELRAMGASKSDAESAYQAAEVHETASPRSWWGAVQGLTRVSQDAAYQDDRYTLDRLASTVLQRAVRKVAV